MSTRRHGETLRSKPDRPNRGDAFLVAWFWTFLDCGDEKDQGVQNFRRTSDAQPLLGHAAVFPHAGLGIQPIERWQAAAHLPGTTLSRFEKRTGLRTPEVPESRECYSPNSVATLGVLTFLMGFLLLLHLTLHTVWGPLPGYLFTVDGPTKHRN